MWGAHSDPFNNPSEWELENVRNRIVAWWQVRKQVSDGQFTEWATVGTTGFDEGECSEVWQVRVECTMSYSADEVLYGSRELYENYDAVSHLKHMATYTVKIKKKNGNWVLYTLDTSGQGTFDSKSICPDPGSDPYSYCSHGAIGINANKSGVETSTVSITSKICSAMAFADETGADTSGSWADTGLDKTNSPIWTWAAPSALNDIGLAEAELDAIVFEVCEY